MQPLAFSEPSALHMSDKVHWAASSPVKVRDELPPGAQRYTSHTPHLAKKKHIKESCVVTFPLSLSLQRRCGISRLQDLLQEFPPH